MKRKYELGQIIAYPNEWDKLFYISQEMGYEMIKERCPNALGKNPVEAGVLTNKYAVVIAVVYLSNTLVEYFAIYNHDGLFYLIRTTQRLDEEK